MHGGYQREEYQTGDDGPEVSILTRSALPCQQPETAWLSRYCAEEIQNRRVYRRLFLAWSRGLQVLSVAEIKR